MKQYNIAATFKDSSFFLLVVEHFLDLVFSLAFTPCVFPMIPILSSIIVKASQNESMSAKKGFLMSFVYVLANEFCIFISRNYCRNFWCKFEVLYKTLMY